jgi:hypothetical protein
MPPARGDCNLPKYGRDMKRDDEDNLATLML